ncbi:MAG: putative MerR family transcriptional regulator [Myxococcaceae bacterium]|nr:putative MerR family transcriptional regulator [Myxococcaceae bacterium]
MKISELSQTSEISVPTIKFYIREGLLPAGARTAMNQADYGQAHVERLSLIRALREQGGLSIEVIARVLAAADSAKKDAVIAAVNALERPAQVAVDVSDERLLAAEQMLLSLVRRRAWRIEPSDGALRDAIKALAVVLGWYMPQDDHAIDVYAEAADLVAKTEIPEGWAPDASPDAAVRYAVLGTVVLEPFILALRRMANVARTRKVVKQRPAQPDRAKKPAATRRPGKSGRAQSAAEKTRNETSSEGPKVV